MERLELILSGCVHVWKYLNRDRVKSLNDNRRRWNKNALSGKHHVHTTTPIITTAAGSFSVLVWVVEIGNSRACGRR